MLCGHPEDVALQLLLGSACLKNTFRISQQQYEQIKSKLQGEYWSRLDERDREAFDFGRSSGSITKRTSNGSPTNIPGDPIEYFQYRQQEVIPTIKPIIEEVLDGLLKRN